MRLIAFSMFILFAAILVLLADAHAKNQAPPSVTSQTAENQGTILAAAH